VIEIHQAYHRKWGVWLLIINALIKTLALWFTFIAVGRFMLSKPHKDEFNHKFNKAQLPDLNTRTNYGRQYNDYLIKKHSIMD